MCNTSARALFVKNRTQSQLLLNGAFCRQRNPLIAVNELIVQVIDDIVFLAENDRSPFSGNRFNVKGILFGEAVLYLVQYLEDFTGELNTAVGITNVAELIGRSIAKCFDNLIQPKEPIVQYCLSISTAPS